MLILSYRKMLGGKISIRELYLADFGLVVNQFGVAARDPRAAIAEAVEIEELATGNLNQGFIEMMITAIRQGHFFTRHLQQTLGIKTDDNGWVSIMLPDDSIDTTQSGLE